MQAYEGLHAYYGDLHNHCGISYGHGSLEEALLNAREQLDFCSVTGHASWPDMPAGDAQVQYLVDYHVEGFARLAAQWPEVQRLTEAYHEDGKFVTFLSHEMHSCADGDRTILYDNAAGDILTAESVPALHKRLRQLRREGVGVIAFPHHIGYRRGQRGINWDTFAEEFAPVVEIISMHGCSEANENTRPFLHVMGPSDHESTMQYGLEQGHFFGVIGSTDHHSAHPGSYGHGRTGLWAAACTREAIWEALEARRTYALTGDRIQLEFAIDQAPMGSQLAATDKRLIEFHVCGGGPLDCIDIVKSGELVRRFSECDFARPTPSDLVRTKLHFEVGWGERQVQTDWDVRFGIADGQVLAVEPRFRGPEVVSPLEADSNAPASHHLSHWQPAGPLGVRFTTTTRGNPNNSTNASQGVCLEVEMPAQAEVRAVVNGHLAAMPLQRLLEGARAGRLGKIGTAGYRFNRAPRQWEFDWEGRFEDTACQAGDVYYLRVRQKNDQWAWSSPIRVGSR